MSEEIKQEQEKLANHLKNLSAEARQKQGLALMSYLQGFEIGYQTAQLEKEEKNNVSS